MNAQSDANSRSKFVVSKHKTNADFFSSFSVSAKKGNEPKEVHDVKGEKVHGEMVEGRRDELERRWKC